MGGSGEGARFVAAGLLFVAAAIHAVAAYEPDHLERQPFFGFFWTAAALQALLALAVLRRSLPGAAIAFGVNVFLLLLWTVTRLTPVPGAAVPEPIDVLGVASKAVELASLPLLAGLVRGLPVRVPPGEPAQAL